MATDTALIISLFQELKADNQELKVRFDELKAYNQEIIQRLDRIEKHVIKDAVIEVPHEVLQDSCEMVDKAGDRELESLIPPIITPRYMVENWAAIRM